MSPWSKKRISQLDGSDDDCECWMVSLLQLRVDSFVRYKATSRLIGHFPPSFDTSGSSCLPPSVGGGERHIPASNMIGSDGSPRLLNDLVRNVLQVNFQFLSTSTMRKWRDFFSAKSKTLLGTVDWIAGCRRSQTGYRMRFGRQSAIGHQLLNEDSAREFDMKKSHDEGRTGVYLLLAALNINFARSTPGWLVKARRRSPFGRMVSGSHIVERSKEEKRAIVGKNFMHAIAYSDGARWRAFKQKSDEISCIACQGGQTPTPPPPPQSLVG